MKNRIAACVAERLSSGRVVPRQISSSPLLYFFERHRAGSPSSDDARLFAANKIYVGGREGRIRARATTATILEDRTAG